MRRIAFLLVALAAVYTAGQYSMNHWTAWTAETKASVWVAFGTLALALATAWSVWETRLVIRGEDRRHQQSFAPLLVLTDPINAIEDYKQGYTLRNHGTGIALNVTVVVHASAALAKYEFPPETVHFSTASEAEAWANEHKAISYHGIADRLSCSAAYPGGWDEFSQDFLATHGQAVEGLSYSLCVIRYKDMFGNPYETRYTDNLLDSFEWVQPENLRISG